MISDTNKKFQTRSHEQIGAIKKLKSAVSGASELSSLNVLRIEGQKGCAVCFTTKQPVKRP